MAIKRFNRPGFMKRVFVLTDGCTDSKSKCLELASSADENCKIYTLGLGSGVDTDLVQNLAKNGKGS